VPSTTGPATTASDGRGARRKPSARARSRTCTAAALAVVAAGSVLAPAASATATIAPASATAATALPAAARTRSTAVGATAVLPAGGILAAGARLATTTGFVLVMQPDGNLVEYGLGRALWGSRSHVRGSSATLQTDGNLVVRSPLGKPVWATHTAGHPGSSLSLESAGDTVLRGADATALWDDQVGASYLAPTGRLTTGQSIASPDGGTRLTMGTDGNLVVRTLVGGAWVAVWASHTSRHPGSYVRMRADGDLVVFSPANTVLWNSTTPTAAPIHLSVEGGGDVRFRDPAGTTIAAIGDDYPLSLRAPAQDSVVDPWGYYNRECVSFVAARVLRQDRVAVLYAGSAHTWAAYARAHGYTADSQPARGSVGWTDAGTYGHVAVVEEVAGPLLVVEEYNYAVRGGYSHRVVPAAAFKAFLHFELPAGPLPAPARAGTARRAPARYLPGR